MSELAARAIVEGMLENHGARMGESMSRADRQLVEARSAATGIYNNLVESMEQRRGMGDLVTGHEQQLQVAALIFDEMESWLATSRLM